MSKIGVARIVGPKDPLIEQDVTYTISEWLEDTPMELRDSSKVTWVLYKVDKSGELKSLGTKKEGKYIFGTIAVGKKYVIKAYLEESELKNQEGITVIPKDNLIRPKTTGAKAIGKVELRLSDGTLITKVLSYMDIIYVKAKCINMHGDKVIVSLWNGEKQTSGNNANSTLVKQSEPITVDTKGNVYYSFNLMGSYGLAQQGSSNSAEFYVTVDYNAMKKEDKTKTSETIKKNELIILRKSLEERKLKQFAQVNKEEKKPENKTNTNYQLKPGTDSAKGSTKGNTKNNTSDSKGIITSVKLVNKKGESFKDIPKFGDTIYLLVKGKNLKGEKFRLNLWEDDDAGKNDLLYTEELVFTEDDSFRKEILLTSEMQMIGEYGNDINNKDWGEYWFEMTSHQELFAEIIILEGMTKKSSIVNVNIDEKFKAEYDKTMAKVSTDDVKGDNKNGVCEAEARVRAFMRMIKVGEGTGELGVIKDKATGKVKEYVTKKPELGYKLLFGGETFSNMNKHPEKVIKKNGYSSSAAGAYQIKKDTWEEISTHFKKHNISDFDELSQDKMCLILLKYYYKQDRPQNFYEVKFWKDKAKTVRDYDREKKAKEFRKRFKNKQGDIIRFIIDEDFNRAVLLASLCWASLPDSPYGQPSISEKDSLELYNRFLKEELEGKTNLHLEKGFLKDFGYNCCGSTEKISVSSNGIVTYHIYHDGRIEKHIPKKIKEGNEKKYMYVYHDEKNVEHNVCIADWHTTKEKKQGTYHKVKPTHSNVLSDENVSEGQTSRRIKYENGDIAEYGYHDTKKYIWILFSAKSSNIELLTMPNSINYDKGNIKIAFAFSGTKRKYTGVDTFAGFIGVLAKTGYKLTTTGSCFSEGSCFPSIKHHNGRSVDLGYLYETKKDQDIINMAETFHFEDRFKGIKDYCKGLKNADEQGTLHNSHLHIGKFNGSIIKIVKEK